MLPLPTLLTTWDLQFYMRVGAVASPLPDISIVAYFD